MSKSNPFRHLAVAGFACLLAASCSNLTDDDGTTLPDGKYPMTFTASVDGLTATRATTDNSWTGGEEVAIQIGSEVKAYAAAAGGSLTVANGGTSFYWQTTGSITVNAWYPYCATKPAVADLKVKADQSTDADYQSSDYLEAVDANVAFNSPALTFKHRTAKVVVTLTAGEGITDLADATVTLFNQTGVEGDGIEIISKKETPADGSATTYTALVIPQQMLGKQFIKVTIGAESAARDYFYTPVNATDANLEAGKQYAYAVTVKKTGLEVTVTGNGASWTHTSVDTSPDPSVNFHITAPKEGVTIAAVSGGTLTGSNGSFTLSGGNAVSITATSIYIKSIKGLYEVDEGGTTYTLKSDLLITGHTLADAQVGDFYCKSNNNEGYLIPGDASLTGAQQQACIGVVMKVGRGTDEGHTNDDGKDANNWTDNDTYKLKDGTTDMPAIHGYVIALKDAYDGQACAWGSYGTLIGTDINEYTLFCGYSNTQKIKKYTTDNGKNLQADFPAAYHTSEGYELSYPSPANSSGWFLPSSGQCWCWYQNKDVLKSSMDKVSGDGWQNYYWSSSEHRGANEIGPAWTAWLVDFDVGRMGGGHKNRNTSYKVRSCLVF